MGGVRTLYTTCVRWSFPPNLKIRIATLKVIFIPPTGQVTIPSEITFQLEDADPPVFTLTCTSTGGPATTVSWRRDGTMLSDDSTYSITSQVTDSVTATYTHTLTVTGRLVGEYQCSVFNTRTPSGSSRSLTVLGKRPEIWHGLCIYVEKERLPLSIPQALTHQLISMLHKWVPPVSESSGLHQTQEPL